VYISIISIIQHKNTNLCNNQSSFTGQQQQCCSRFKDVVAKLLNKTYPWQRTWPMRVHSSSTIAEVCMHGGSMPLLCTLSQRSWFSACSNEYWWRSSSMSAADASKSSMLALSDSFAVANDVMYSHALARTAHLL